MEFIYHDSYVILNFAECVHTFHYVTAYWSGQPWVTDDGIVFVIHIILCNEVCMLPIQAQQMMVTSTFTRSYLHFV